MKDEVFEIFRKKQSQITKENERCLTCKCAFVSLESCVPRWDCL